MEVVKAMQQVSERVVEQVVELQRQTALSVVAKVLKTALKGQVLGASVELEEGIKGTMKELRQTLGAIGKAASDAEVVAIVVSARSEEVTPSQRARRMSSSHLHQS